MNPNFLTVNSAPCVVTKPFRWIKIVQMNHLDVELRVKNIKSGKAIYFACVWSCLTHGGWRWIVPQRVHWWRGATPLGREGSLFCLRVAFEGDVSWQSRRGSKINAAKGGSDSLSAGWGSLGWPDWSWMSLLLLNLVYVNRADSGVLGIGGGVCWAAAGRITCMWRTQECRCVKV